MKVFNRVQLREWDRYTIEVDGVDSKELIARAGALLAEEIESLLLQYDHGGPVRIICGLGNNGADGLVVALHLSQFIGDLEVFIVAYSDKIGLDFEFYKAEAQEKDIMIRTIQSKADLPAIDSDTVVIDALFGTGISRPLEALPRDTAEHINCSPAYLVISIDQPSGLPTDTALQGTAVRADYTLSIASRKLASFFPEHAEYVGSNVLIPLELSNDYYQKTATPNFTVDLHQVLLQELYNHEHAFKNQFGHVLFIGGCKGMMGAALLAAEASLRAGCGLVTARVPECGLNIMQTALPEVMLDVDEGRDHLIAIADSSDYQSLCFGCGLGKEVEVELLESVLEFNGPKLIDADGLNLLARHPDLLKRLDESCVLTPHVGEFHRLFGHCTNGYERYERLRNSAMEYGCFIILKGRYTMIGSPEGECHINLTGNPALATAGAGDVLAGYIAGLLARGLSVKDACIRGVFLHGYAGDMLRVEFGDRGAIARDVLAVLARMDKHLLNLLNEEEYGDDGLDFNLIHSPN